MSAISPFREAGLAETFETENAVPLAFDMGPFVDEAAWEAVAEEADWEAAAFAEEDESGAAATGIPARGLEWPGASAAELAFMRAVYERHVANSRAVGGTFTADLPADRLRVIEGSHRARTDAAEAARALLAAARKDLAAAGLADKVQIGIVSAYRPASQQFVIWQGKGRKGGFPYYYRQMLERGRLRPGDYGGSAVAAMATEIGTWVAAPGYSNHQDGLAIDFATGAAGKGLGAIGKRAWFYKWLVANARKFGFHPYEKEAWHWTYRGGAQPAASPPAPATPAARTPVARGNQAAPASVPLLAGHRGAGPALLLRWNDAARSAQEVDVVVHLHGYGRPGMTLRDDIARVSGLDLEPVGGAAGSGRSRPTLTVLPRGDFTGVKQTNGDLYVYKFPSLLPKGALSELVRFSLEQFAAASGAAVPRMGRLILTAHSGGGQALLKILEHADPDEVHVYDALYWDPKRLADWALRHMQADGAGTSRGALRVFYNPGRRRTSRPREMSLRLARAISAHTAAALADRYRVEESSLGHWEIPRQYGWRILADPAADAPKARREPVDQRELEAGFEEADLEEAHVDEWEEDGHVHEAEEDEEVQASLERVHVRETEDDEAADTELLLATAAYEALSSAYEVSDLDRGRARRESVDEAADGELGVDESAPEYEVLSAAFEAADVVHASPELEEEDHDHGPVETEDFEELAAAFEAAGVTGEDVLSEVAEAPEEESFESGEIELGEAESFLDDVYSRELVFEDATGGTVTFPSGATLRVVSGPTGKGEEHYDPWATGNPLLDTGASVRSTRLSESFTVGEFTRSGSDYFDKARIDPDLIRCLQKLRDHVGKPVQITSSYRPYAYNVKLYRARKKEPTQSRHSSGQAVDVRIAGMTGMQIAKTALDVCGTTLGIGIANTFAHIDVRPRWDRWTYFGKGEQDRAAKAEIDAYRKQRLAGGAAPPSTAPPAQDVAPSPAIAPQMLDALGRGLWDTAVRIAIGVGITDVNRLTNMLFYLRHPELRGQRIAPEQRDLAREWIEIRDRWVKPALKGAAATPAQSAPAAAASGAAAAGFSRTTPQRQRFSALVPLLDRHRGDIPLDFLLGWIDVESNGRIDVETSLRERGFFQIHPEESQDNRFDHERIGTDPEYSVQAGIALVRLYASLARKRFAWIPSGSELFWRVVKLQHAMGAGLTKQLFAAMQQRGMPPTSWEVIKAFEPTAGAQALHRLLRVEPGRFARNVDKVFARGRLRAAEVGR
jgi:LAS superfamily LD-carboxypeptidase LdcB